MKLVQFTTPQLFCDMFMFPPNRYRLGRILPIRLFEPRFASHPIGIASAGFYPSVGFADISPARGGFSQAWHSTLSSHDSSHYYKFMSTQVRKQLLFMHFPHLSLLFHINYFWIKLYGWFGSLVNSCVFILTKTIKTLLLISIFSRQSVSVDGGCP